MAESILVSIVFVPEERRPFKKRTEGIYERQFADRPAIELCQQNSVLNQCRFYLSCCWPKVFRVVPKDMAIKAGIDLTDLTIVEVNLRNKRIEGIIRNDKRYLEMNVGERLFKRGGLFVSTWLQGVEGDKKLPSLRFLGIGRAPRYHAIGRR